MSDNEFDYGMSYFGYYKNTPSKRLVAPGYVYVVQNKDNGVYKIGRTMNWTRRYKSHIYAAQALGYTPNLEPLLLYKTEDHKLEEAILHTIVQHKRLLTETYNLDDTDIGHLKEHADVLEDLLEPNTVRWEDAF
jgi:predicted GIY-YIG superfamily endonuclease